MAQDPMEMLRMLMMGSAAQQPPASPGAAPSAMPGQTPPQSNPLQAMFSGGGMGGAAYNPFYKPGGGVDKEDVAKAAKTAGMLMGGK